jgi:hypothetical protein
MCVYLDEINYIFASMRKAAPCPITRALNMINSLKIYERKNEALCTRIYNNCLYVSVCVSVCIYVFNAITTLASEQN